MSAKLYVGNLDPQRPCEKRDLEDLFSKYGELDDVWIARQPPGFAFVTFRSERDANEAVKELDGYKFQGERIKVEVRTGGIRKEPPRGGGGRGRSRSRSRSYRRRSPSRDRRRGRSDSRRRR